MMRTKSAIKLSNAKHWITLSVIMRRPNVRTSCEHKSKRKTSGMLQFNPTKITTSTHLFCTRQIVVNHQNFLSDVVNLSSLPMKQIGRASCRERVCKYV